MERNDDVHIAFLGAVIPNLQLSSETAVCDYAIHRKSM
jgi:hypothetical protein